MLAPSRALWIAFGLGALGVVLFGAGCTHRGKPVIPPTQAPVQTTFYVDAKNGSDTTGNGTQSAPYKSITKALSSLPSPAPVGLTVDIAAGDYDAANGEKFPLEVPLDVSLTGNAYGSGPANGTYIDGFGEDTAYEKLAGAAGGTHMATVVVGAGATVAFSDLYIGAARLAPRAGVSYAALDALGSTSASAATFNAGTPPTIAGAGGILVPGSSFTCTNCVVTGKAFGVAVQSVSGASTAPSLTLSGQAGQSMLVSKTAGILSDGTADVLVSAQTFQGGGAAYSDALAPLSGVRVTPGTVDFGSSSGSQGGNILLGATDAEIDVTVPHASVTAFNDTWNPNVQNANASGQYQQTYTFAAGASGSNVRVARGASGASVSVGPYVAPTSSPSSSPTSSSSPTASPS